MQSPPREKGGAFLAIYDKVYLSCSLAGGMEKPGRKWKTLLNPLFESGQSKLRDITLVPTVLFVLSSKKRKKK